MSPKANAESGYIDLSIIIINWNTRELTAQCLRSVWDNLSDTTINYEIIVVDNASSDGSAQMIRDDFHLVRLICNDNNKGFVRANNQACSIAKGRYLLLLNSDTRLLDNTMPRIIKYLDKHPQVGIATGKVLNSDESFQPPYQRFPGLIGAIVRHTINSVKTFNTPLSRHHKYTDLDPNQIHNVDSVTGAYLFIRSTLVAGNKIFDEDIFMYYEDTLLCYLIRKQGYQIVYLPYATIIHYHGMSSNQVRPDALFNSFIGSKIYMERVYGENLAVCYAAIVRVIWRVLAFVFALLRIFPFHKFKEKAALFKSLLVKSC